MIQNIKKMCDRNHVNQPIDICDSEIVYTDENVLIALLWVPSK